MQITTSSVLVLLAAVARAQDSGTTSLVNGIIAAMPQCGQACLSQLPAWTNPLTLDAITAVCKDLQNQLAIMVPCFQKTCNATDYKIVYQEAALVPNGCKALNVATNATLPPFVPMGSPSATASPSAPVATSSKSSAIQGLQSATGILATAVTFAALLF
ncbi:hypothetical protein BC830DRAFT_1146891 [Chytriomyces sp. MP71]|nr:hypothetical protein BC830DRAFT_1146891 [Chytriomyces sp. MP71]